MRYHMHKPSITLISPSRHIVMVMQQAKREREKQAKVVGQRLHFTLSFGAAVEYFYGVEVTETSSRLVFVYLKPEGGWSTGNLFFQPRRTGIF
jgi:hypothetical protein